MKREDELEPEEREDSLIHVTKATRDKTETLTESSNRDERVK